MEPFDAYRRMTLGPVAQTLVGGVRGTVLYSILGAISGLAALAGQCNRKCDSRSRQRRHKTTDKQYFKNFSMGPNDKH